MKDKPVSTDAMTGAFLPSASATARTSPVAAIDDRIELMVAIPIAPKRGDVQGRRQVVGAGTLLARRVPGRPGTSGVDATGREIPVREPRKVRLPQGPNTTLNVDGTELLAACDGEVVMRNLLVEVQPMSVHDGDVQAGAYVVSARSSLFITGSVGESANVEATEDIYIQGHVREASVVSRSGNITVIGSVTGSPQQAATLEAGGDITCGPIRHGRAVAGGDVHLLAEAWQSSLHMGGNLFLDQLVEQCLRDVVLQVEGGIFPRMQYSGSTASEATERQHVRVAISEQAWIALHTAPPLQFHGCTVLDLSANGARLKLLSPQSEYMPGTLVQFKFKLPSTAEQTLSVARVCRRVAPGVISVNFLQITQRDQNHLTTFLMRMHMSRPGMQAALRDRRMPGRRES
jgi:hypothetical protein